MATTGVWGDDPEVQALCEVYDRPAEIWAPDAVHGARLLRVFASQRAEAAVDPRPPIRLSYIGGGHYDSLRGVGWAAALLRSDEPGALELRIITAARERARVRGRGSASVPAGRADEAADALQHGLAASRADFQRAQAEEDGNLELALLASLRHNDAPSGGGGGSAVAPSAGAAAEGDSEVEAEMMRRVVAESLSAVVSASDAQVAAAVAASRLESGSAGAGSAGSAVGGGGPSLNALYDAVLSLTEEEQLECSMLGLDVIAYAARKAVGAAPPPRPAVGEGGGGGDDEMDEGTALALALEMSRGGA
jgi:hypothetical protein